MKVLYFTNIPSPYRIDFFNLLNEKIKLTVVFDKLFDNDRNGNWFNNSKINFDYHIISPGRILKLNKMLNNNFDIIIIGGYSTINGALASVLLKLKKKKYVINADGGFVGNDNIITKFIKTYFISSANYYLSTSKGTNEYLTHYGAKKENIYIYPFTSLNHNEILSKPIKYNVKLKNRIKAGYNYKILLIAVGQFIYRKGFDILLEAVKKINNPEIGVLIIGGGPLKSDYLEFVKKNNLSNVHIIDFKKKEELLEIYKFSDVFVLPTREDIWGLVINEALSLGLPVITTKKCLAGLELINKKYLYDSNDPKQLVKILNDIIELSDFDLEKLAKKNLDIAKKYTIEEMANRHVQIFNDIIKLIKK